ncbi:hypothetical protein ACFLSJ_04520, partial [Verrucomicrobiota bacterium]
RSTAATVVACLSAAVLSISPGTCSAQIGNPFPVNQYTNQSQTAPDVALAADGSFVVVWESDGQDGSYQGVYARAFDSSGTPRGNELQVNQYATGWQSSPSVSMNATGGFVVAWESESEEASEVFARLYGAGGSPAGAEFRVNQYDADTQGAPDVAMNATGDFVVVWQSYEQDSSYYGVYARKYDRRGVPQLDEFRVNVGSNLNQRSPSTDITPAGTFVVTWESEGQDGSREGVYARLYSPVCFPAGSEFRVNQYYPDSQGAPSVAMDTTGNFVVVWQSMAQDRSDNGVYGRRYNVRGDALGDEFRVNQYTQGNQGAPRTTMNGSGMFAVVWQSEGQDGDGDGVYGRLYDDGGAPLGDEFRVNAYTAGTQGLPSAGMDDAGGFAAAWTSEGQDGSEHGVFATVEQGGLWAGAASLPGSWKWLSWFGFFHGPIQSWIYHLEHGWMYAAGSAANDIWLYTPDMSWLWTGYGAYPYLFRFQDAAWLYYVRGTTGPRWFFNLSTGAWETVWTP